MGERTVNARQLEVLKWIISGSPAGVMIGETYKTTAAALQNRRLVKVSKGRKGWRAEATDAGKHFARTGEYPEGHWRGSDATSARPVTAPGPRPPSAATVQPRRPVTALRPVDQMLKDLADHDGVLAVEDPSYFAMLVASANRYGKVPEGKILEITHKSRREAVVALIDPPDWMTATLEAVPVPERLVQPHPAVAAIAEDREHRLRFRSVVRKRAVRVLDALAKECQRRGYAVHCEPWHRGARSQRGDLVVEIHGHEHGLEVREQNDRVPHEPSAQERRDAERYSWSRIPTHDSKPSGRLEMRIHGGLPVRTDTFADTKTLPLEERLAVLMQELELRAADSERRRLKREAEALKQREAWERTRDEAITAFQGVHRGKVLEEQAGRWMRVSQMRSFLEAMTDRVADLKGEEADMAQSWLAWSREYVEELDPLLQPLGMPKEVDPTPEQLKPFMGGRSTYGPNGW